MTLVRLYQEKKEALIGYVTAILGDREEAKDVVSDAMETILGDKGTGMKGVDNPIAWIFKVCRSRAIDVYRRRAVKSRVLSELGLSMSWQDPERETDKEIASEVIEEVSRLPSPVREVIEILYFRDAGYEEAESLTGLSERTLRRHRDRGIRLLRKRLVAAR